ncbi:MAG: LysE family translocator, partial [Burkholderiaceae bacterium]|nr:LysE family translocator [Burkholderiaceae bacterium]
MINTSLYMVFLVTSLFAVATPGPGVLMSLTGVIRYGFGTGFWTILGVASGTVVMAIISSTGLGIVIATSPELYGLIKTLGACYMGYLGIRLYRAKPFSFQLANKEKSQPMTLTQKGFLWVQGVMLQMTNPMLIM